MSSSNSKMDISSEPRLLKLNKHLGFPFTFKLKEDSGVRYFINEMGNGIVHIGKIGLEDLVTYHEAGFGIIDCCYCNSGRNNTINHVIEDLYTLRHRIETSIKIQHRLLLNY